MVGSRSMCNCELSIVARVHWHLVKELRNYVGAALHCFYEKNEAPSLLTPSELIFMNMAGSGLRETIE